MFLVNKMTMEQARLWIVISSLSATGLTLCFLAVGPALGYPISYEDALRLGQIILPLFLGYLGAATHFLFKSEQKKAPHESKEHMPSYFSFLVKGSLITFLFIILSCIIAYGYTNRMSATPGIGMSVDTLATMLSLALGLLAATTSIIVYNIFPADQKSNQHI